jgi:hypothetical protein
MIYSDVPALGTNGITNAQVFIGRDSLVIDVYLGWEFRRNSGFRILPAEFAGMTYVPELRRNCRYLGQMIWYLEPCWRSSDR